jgi:hypothetical protein
MLKEQCTFSIGSASAELGCSTRQLQLAGHLGAIPPARRDHNGRLCSEFDIALLKNIGRGSWPRKLERAEEVLGAGA